MSVGRKVFHCVVDDTALTVNISEIKKWTAQGSITLIVPLYSMCVPLQASPAELLAEQVSTDNSLT
jgi:hypothetical protein